MADRSAINAPVRTTRFEVELELPGGPVPGWSEIQLPSTTTETVTYREGPDPEYDFPLWGRTEWDDLTMSRGAKQGEKMLWDWREKVNQGKLDEARKTINVKIFDATGNETLMRYEFKKAWPTEYSPPQLDATAVGGDSAMGQEEITIAYDRYRRTQ